jgi:polysaccharide export outer membrane protein
MKILRLLFLLVFPLFIISCGSQRKVPQPYYLDKITDTTGEGELAIQELKIQKNDQLSIQVYSASTVPEVDRLYNLPVSESAGGLATGGFLVDAKGNIEYPRLGTIHAEGLTKQELADQIRKRLTEPVELLKDPTVIIRFINLKITVLGQVGREGVVSIPGEKVTILEAVGLAGGVTDYGRKDKIKIIRETDGKRKIGEVNLSSDSIFQSPYYYLVQNDVLIVEPTKKKARDAEQSIVAQRISFALTLVTVAATLFNIFKN